MARTLKVYGGRYGDMRAIIAAESAAEVIRLVPHMTRHEMTNFWSETFNDGEIAAAMAQPKTLLGGRDNCGPVKQWKVLR